MAQGSASHTPKGVCRCGVLCHSQQEAKWYGRETGFSSGGVASVLCILDGSRGAAASQGGGQLSTGPHAGEFLHDCSQSGKRIDASVSSLDCCVHMFA